MKINKRDENSILILIGPISKFKFRNMAIPLNVNIKILKSDSVKAECKSKNMNIIYKA